MNDDSAAELFCTLRIGKEWMDWVHEAACKRPEIEFIGNFYVGSSDPHLTMEVTQYERHVLAVLGRYFLDYDPLEARRILMAMAEEDVAHSDGGMP